MMTFYARGLRLSTDVDKRRVMDDTAKKPGKSDRTRAAILEAARELFATEGYERTTVRDIAARASIDPALVIRYFGSKEALFVRAADIELRMPDLAGAPGSRGEAIVRHFLSIWEGEDGNPGMTILLRSAASNPVAAGKLRDVFAQQVLPALGRAGGDPAQAGLVSSQLLGLALCRYVLELPPVVALPVEHIVREVGATLERYLGDGRSRDRCPAGPGTLTL
jgi:AcrR family transcriptional regulator